MKLHEFTKAVQAAITEAKGQVKELNDVANFTFTVPVIVHDGADGPEVIVNHHSPGAARIEFTMHVPGPSTRTVMPKAAGQGGFPRTNVRETMGGQ